tara:strand:- start:45 stop:1079 length:1035 start_codon:yes stop_codon:yes gene_type:complete
MASKKTTKDYGDRQFNKMVKALKLSEEEVIDLIGGVRRNKKTGQIEHHKKGGPVVKAKVGKHIKKGMSEAYRAIADKLKSRKSKPKKTTATRSEAKLVEGSGDMSDPTNRAGKMRTGKQQRRGGATSQARDAISDTEKDKLARSKAARGSYKRSQKLKKGSLAQLSDEFDKLLKGRQRAERVKGSRSKYYKVFKARNPLKIQRIRGADGKIKKADTRGYTDSSKKTGGPVVKARIGGLLKAGKAIKKSISGGKKPRKKTPNTPTYKRKKDPTQMSPAEYKIMMRKRKIEKDQDLRGADDPRNYPGKPFSNVKRQADKKRNLKRKGGGKITYRMTGGQVVDAGYD